MSTLEHPDEPTVRVLPPEEAFGVARLLPARDVLAIEGLTDDEWRAFQEALAET
ncbi:MAG: hypothetical protein ACYDGN_16230 [Acidimicrobiales bacterium]